MNEKLGLDQGHDANLLGYSNYRLRPVTTPIGILFLWHRYHDNVWVLAEFETPPGKPTIPAGTVVQYSGVKYMEGFYRGETVPIKCLKQATVVECYAGYAKLDLGPHYGSDVYRYETRRVEELKCVE